MPCSWEGNRGTGRKVGSLLLGWWYWLVSHAGWLSALASTPINKYETTFTFYLDWQWHGVQSCNMLVVWRSVAFKQMHILWNLMAVTYHVNCLILCVIAKGFLHVAEINTVSHHVTLLLVNVDLCMSCWYVGCLICRTSTLLGRLVKLFSCCRHIKSATSWNKRLSLVVRLFTRHVDELRIMYLLTATACILTLLRVYHYM